MAEQDVPKDFFEFMQKMWNPMGFPIPGMIAPTMNIEDIEKKIAELKAVETWLTMNTGFVQMTVKTLEMQKAGLESLQAAGKAAADAAVSRGRGEIDVEVGWVLRAEQAKLAPEVGDIVEAPLFRRVFQGTDKIAGDGVLRVHGYQGYVRAALQVAPEPAFAEGVPPRSRSRGTGTRTRPA